MLERIAADESASTPRPADVPDVKDLHVAWRRGELSVREDKRRVIAAVVERIAIGEVSEAVASSETDPRTASSSPGGPPCAQPQFPRADKSPGHATGSRRSVWPEQKLTVLYRRLADAPVGARSADIGRAFSDTRVEATVTSPAGASRTRSTPEPPGGTRHPLSSPLRRFSCRHRTGSVVRRIAQRRRRATAAARAAGASGGNGRTELTLISHST